MPLADHFLVEGDRAQAGGVVGGQVEHELWGNLGDLVVLAREAIALYINSDK